MASLFSILCQYCISKTLNAERTLSLRITVEVKIDHDIPLSLARSNGSTESQNLTGQHPPDQTDRVTTLVVGWDSDIDELGWGISIAKSNDWDVDVGSLLDGLGIGTGVGDDDEAGFLEGAGDVVGEVTRGETTSDGDGTGVGGELQDSALSVRTSRNDTDIGGVVDGCDDAGCKDDLLPERENCQLLMLCVCAKRESNRNELCQDCAYQVLPMLMTLIPSGRVFQRYGSM